MEARGALPQVNEQNHFADKIQLAKSNVREYIDQEDDDYEEDFYQARDEETPIK